MDSDISVLEEFSARISAADGMAVADFQAELYELFEGPRSHEDVTDYRMSKSRWKKISDEVTPVSRFLRFSGIETGRIPVSAR